ncbi:MAG: type II secretion system GspH family protein [Thiobacillaceae bacterium]|jgi:type II secretory pathway pseudopilin PulG|nr:type II secretion system GspH family protein [Thiobacillaceae bacterium]
MGNFSGNSRPGQAGFTLLWVLFLLAVIGLGLAALGRTWQLADLREKEAQLLFVGDEYRRALESYYRAAPGNEKSYPKALADLLRDKRYPYPVRHLRRLYRDPMTNSLVWGLVRQGEVITGVYSLGVGTPLKIAGFPRQYKDFADKDSYQDWVFVAYPKGFDAGQAGEVADNVIKLPSPEERKLCDDALQVAMEACQAQAQPSQYENCMQEASKVHIRCAYNIKE